MATKSTGRVEPGPSQLIGLGWTRLVGPGNGTNTGSSNLANTELDVIAGKWSWLTRRWLGRGKEGKQMPNGPAMAIVRNRQQRRGWARCLLGSTAWAMGNMGVVAIDKVQPPTSQKIAENGEIAIESGDVVDNDHSHGGYRGQSQMKDLGEGKLFG